MFSVDRLVRTLQADEGFRGTPYLDSVGVWTVGYGTTFIHGQAVRADTPALAEKEALVYLKADALGAIDDCQALYPNVFPVLCGVHQEILVCLAYQLGRNRLARFKHMNAAIAAFDYAGWQRELKDSRLYRQATQRVERYLQAIERRYWDV